MTLRTKTGDGLDLSSRLTDELVELPRNKNYVEEYGFSMPGIAFMAGMRTIL